MNLFNFTSTELRALIYRQDETPRILRYIYDLIDEDLENGEPACGKP